LAIEHLQVWHLDDDFIDDCWVVEVVLLDIKTCD
jgi:hypothetical protein